MMKRHAMLAAVLGALAWPALAETPKAPAPAPVPAAEATTVEELYKAGGKTRDPFVPVDAVGSASASPSVGPMTAEDFSIHSLALKGIMQDKAGAFAVLTDPKFGASFVLKKGRLFNFKGKPVPGVTGVVKPKQKMVQLITSDKDVQVLILGEGETGEGK